MAWYKNFNRDKEGGERVRILSEIDGKKSLIKSLQKDIENHRAMIFGKKKKIKPIFNPLGWFSKEQSFLRGDIKSIENSLSAKEAKLYALGKTVKDMIGLVQEKMSEISKYDGCDEFVKKALLENMVAEIGNLFPKLELIRKRMEKVDFSIKPLIIQLQDEKSKREKEQGIINKAKQYDMELSSASNGAERAQIHQECERVLGVGKPREIIRAQEPKIGKMDRDIKKLEDRIVGEAAKADRDVKEVIIDGNNMCYESGNEWVGLSIPKAASFELKKQFEVTVVFDAVIRKRLGLGDGDIKKHFDEDIKVHVVATKKSADETIIDRASNSDTTFIISNDRFGDYKDKEAVKSNRIIRHEAINGRILISDLGINASYSA